MKVLQEQYNLIKEGKGNKAHFLKTAFRLFPDMLSPVNTFEDTVKILKNRSILSEGIGGVVTKGTTPDWHKIFKEKITEETKKVVNAKQNGDKSYTVEYSDGTTKKIAVSNDAWDEINDKYGKSTTLKEAKVGDILKHKLTGAEFKITKISGNNVEGKYTKLGGMEGKAKVGDTNKTNKNLIGKTYELISEAKEAKAKEKESTKEVTDMETKGYDYKDKKNYDNVFGEEFLKGFYTEMGDPKNEGKDVNELKQIVAKNLAKDCNYYVKDGQFGVKGVGYQTEVPGLGTPKEAKGKFKSSGYGDLKENEDKDFNSWKAKLYNIIMTDAGLDKEDIAVDEFEIKKYWKEGKTPDEVYNNIWLKDAGNFRSIGESFKSLKENKDPKAETKFYNSLKIGDKAIYDGPEKNGFMKGEKVEVVRSSSSSTFQKTLTVKKGDKKLVVKGHGSLKPLNESSLSSLKESVLRAFISETIKEVLAENMGSEDELYRIVSKYVKDADEVNAELNNYYESGYKGFSDSVQANLSRDPEFQSWVQKGHDEETFKREITDLNKEFKRRLATGDLDEDLTPEDEAEFTRAIEDAEQLYEKTGSVKGAMKYLPKEYNRFKAEIEQHLIQKYEG
jgi:hypothetical protein